MLTLLRLPLLLWASTACTGAIGDPGSEPGSPGFPHGTGPGAAGSGAASGRGQDAASATSAKVVMRRLTRREYDNTVRDVLGVQETPAAKSFPPEETALHFDNNGEALAFPPTLADRALAAAASLAKSVSSAPARFSACASTSKDEACARSVIGALAQQAYRRPLEPAELEPLLGVYRTGASRGFEHGLELAATSVLIALPFFYRIERGENVEQSAKPASVRPTSWEMASRLSYLFLGSSPDAALLEAAAADQLKDAKAIEQQARRLLATPAAKQSVAHFHRQWLRLDGIASAAKDPQLFPAYSGEAPATLRREVELFLESIAFGGGGFKDLLTAPYGFVNAQTAPLYGVSAAASAPLELVRTDFDRAQRAGFLTLGGTLAMLADFAKTSPVRRGVFVRENLLCDRLPPPPPGAAATTADSEPGLTRRQQVDRHSSDPACSGCHRLIDPIGLAFENYDAAGQWRTSADGQAIDVSGNALGTSIGEFSGAVALAQRIADSPEGQSCFVRQLFRFANGRGEDNDQPDIQRIAKLVGEGTPDYLEVLVQLTQSEAFLFMPTPEVLP